MVLQRLFMPAVLIFTASSLAACYFVPERLLTFIIGITVFYLMAAWRLNDGRTGWWNFVIMPLLLFLGTVGYGMMISETILLIIVGLLGFVAQIFYWYYFMLYAVRPSSYPPFSLERLSLSLSVLALYFGSSALFGLSVFLNFSFLNLLALMALYSLLLLYQWSWVGKIPSAKAWRVGLVVWLTVLQIFIAALFLPLDFHAQGFLTASVYYLFLFILSEKIAESLRPAKYRLALAVVAAGWLAVFITARWF